MKKFFLNSFLLGTILIVILSLLENSFDEKALEDKCRKSNWSLSFENQHFDFAFCGDSRVYNMIHIPTIQNITQSQGINLGYTGTIYEEQYLIVKKFLENGNTIDRIYIQADLLSFDSSKRSKHQFRIYNYLPYIGKDSTITNIIQDNFRTTKFLLWKYVPLAKYIEYNLEYPITFLLKDFSQCMSDFDSFGSEMKTGRSPAFLDGLNEYAPTKTSSKKDSNSGHLVRSELVNGHTMEYFKRLVSICRNNGTEIVLYTPPIYASASNQSGHNQSLERFLGQIAADVDISYLSFLSDSICHNEAYFFDGGHTNEVGTKAFSKLIAKNIIQEETD